MILGTGNFDSADLPLFYLAAKTASRLLKNRKPKGNETTTNNNRSRDAGGDCLR